MMEKLFSVVLAILWGVAVLYVLVGFVSAVIKGIKKLKHRKDANNDRIGTTGTNTGIAGADFDFSGDCFTGSSSADNSGE